jgi:hypothetical protein
MRSCDLVFLSDQRSGIDFKKHPLRVCQDRLCNHIYIILGEQAGVKAGITSKFVACRVLV